MLTVDFFYDMLYLLGQFYTASFFSSGNAFRIKRNDPWLLVLPNHFPAVKGHFCSFLLSNILGYLAFVDLDFLPFWSAFRNPFILFEKTSFYHSSLEYFASSEFCFWGFLLVSGFPSIFWSVDVSPDLNDLAFFLIPVFLFSSASFTGFFWKAFSLFDSFQFFFLVFRFLHELWFLIFVYFRFSIWSSDWSLQRVDSLLW